MVPSIYIHDVQCWAGWDELDWVGRAPFQYMSIQKDQGLLSQPQLFYESIGL